MSDLGRRRFVLELLAGAAVVQSALGPLGAARADAPTVYVFAVLDLRPHVLEKMLEAEMPGVDVTVFGRVGDFSRALVEAPPDAALALAPVLTTFGLRPELQGTLGGSPSEDYLVLSEVELQASQLGSMPIGCIDLVGRKNLPGFVATVLGLSSEPEVMRVTKVEDLLQLLQFQRVRAILVGQRFLPELQARTKMKFNILHVPSAKVLRMAIAFPGNRRAVEGSLRGLSRAVIERLGVDAWQG
ncbi:MAG TPA: hypothetical protein VMG12_34290 [Polyangiaceae bacterium]|nr:hypothetical protein [Polyangiaceae bacterium]